MSHGSEASDPVPACALSVPCLAAGAVLVVAGLSLPGIIKLYRAVLGSSQPSKNFRSLQLIVRASLSPSRLYLRRCKLHPNLTGFNGLTSRVARRAKPDSTWTQMDDARGHNCVLRSGDGAEVRMSSTPTHSVQDKRDQSRLICNDQHDGIEVLRRNWLLIGLWKHTLPAQRDRRRKVSVAGQLGGCMGWLTG